MDQKPKTRALADLANNQEGIVFAALAAKDEVTRATASRTTG